MAGHGRTIRLRDVNHAWRHVHGDNARAEIGQTTRELSVTAGDVENGFAALNCEQPLLRRRDKLQMEVVAVAHAAFHKSALASQTARTASFNSGKSPSLTIAAVSETPKISDIGAAWTGLDEIAERIQQGVPVAVHEEGNRPERGGPCGSRACKASEGARGDQCHGADERKAVVHRKDAPTSATVRIGKDQEDYHNSGLLRIFVRRRAR